MFSKLISGLSGSTPAKDTDVDFPTAMAVVMVRLSRTDDTYSASEAACIDQVLVDRFALSIDDASQIRQSAEQAEAIGHDTVKYTQIIKQSVPIEDRLSVMADLWKIVLADGSRDVDESTLMRLIAGLLGVKDRDSALARQSVARAG